MKNLFVNFTVTTALITSMPSVAFAAPIPQSKLPSGAYYTQGSMFNNSWREILNRNGRVCIKTVDGPPNNSYGREEIMISSVSNRDGNLLIDGSNQQIWIDTVSREKPQYQYLNQSYFDRIIGAFSDVPSAAWAWVLLKGNNSDPRTTPEQNRRMEECIKTRGRYVRKIEGRMIECKTSGCPSWRSRF